MTGHIDGAILARSRPDTATYTGKQTNAGVSADIGFDGVPQSVSVNAGRSKVNADYAAVKEQTGIAMNSSDVVVAKASRFDGAYFTTATPEANQTVFKEGVTTTDIQNHMNYKGDAINVGLGAGINPETQKVSPPGISGIGYGKDGDSQTSTTTANVSSLNKPLENSFDKTAVEAQLGAQVQVSQAFDTERRSYRLEMAQKEQELRDKAKEAEKRGDMTTHDDLIAKADRQQHDMVLFDSITGAIYGPNTNGVTGYVARAVAPEVSFRIGQYFKENHGEGTAPHILAHGILAAAVSVATGNDPTTGALSAMGSEAAAPIVAKFLFGDKPISELTAEQKATVSSITSLAGLGLGSTTGNVGSAVNAQQASQVAVDNNQLLNGTVYWKLTPRERRVYDKLVNNKITPKYISNFTEAYAKCGNNSACKNEVQRKYVLASEQFSAIVLQMVAENKLSREDVSVLRDNIGKALWEEADKQAATSDLGGLWHQEYATWSPLGQLTFTDNLNQALSLGRYNELRSQGYSGQALKNKLLQDEITQLIALGIAFDGHQFVYSGNRLGLAGKTLVGNPKVAKVSTSRTPPHMEPESTIESQNPSGKWEYYNFNQMSQKQISKLESEVRQRSPIKVPNNANASIQHKTAQKGSGGYEQIKYTWVDQGVKYESRWHTRTPEAPPTQGNSWVVTRQVQGSRTKRASEKQYLMNNGTWISETRWNQATMSRAKGTETSQQRAILDNGHIKDE